MTPEDALFVRLSQALVAFTIEFDNEAEHRMPHWTTMSGKRPGVWLTSMAMWWNCMRYVADEPIGVTELASLARTGTNLNGMQRWGYVTISPAAPKLVRATPYGLRAREIWAPLATEVEKRWQERFGKDAIDRLRAALYAVVSRFELDFPDGMPILGFGLFSAGPDRKREGSVDAGLPLCVLLARVLLAFAVDFERGSALSLAICANVLRVLDEKGSRRRDIPALSGVSKESIAMAMGILRKKGLAVADGAPPVVRLTAAGVELQRGYRERIAVVEEQWRERFGREEIQGLGSALPPFTLEWLFRGMEPYPDGWRASIRKPDVLPHFPMVLHRGAYPDGS